MNRFLALLLLLALFFSPAVAEDDGELRGRVRAASLVTYVHGMTDEIAAREVGPEGIPYLLELLEDPDFTRRDNVVAFLAHLAGREAVMPLSRCLEQPAARSLAVPDEDRAMLLVPHALGRIAARGDDAALELLLALTDPSGVESPVDRAVSRGVYPAALREDLIEQALWGLSYAETPAAEARLAAVAIAEPKPGQPDLRPSARAVLESAGAAPVSAGAGSRAVDTHTTGDGHLLTFANHVDTPWKMTDWDLDAVLAGASSIAAFPNFDDDVACCARLRRDGKVRSFGTPGDGRDVIVDQPRLFEVLLNPVARVKVVRAITYCGGPGTNIVGCAATPGNGILLVRISANESTLWLHEYGHNAGLPHNPDGEYVMHGRLSSVTRGLTQQECDTYHSPHVNAQATMEALGVCHDNDGDEYLSPGDNCPNVANTSQGDLDNDGFGDACDSCNDADGDGYGVSGSSACPAGAEIDCNDSTADAYPGGPDICDGLDNDCDGQSDESLCSEFDVSGDLKVSGEDLGWLGRAFTECSSDPGVWWRALDFNGNDCVDGGDLSVLGAVWGCSGSIPVCNGQ